MAKLWLRRLSRLLPPHKILSLLKIYLCQLRNFPRCFFEQSWCDYMLTLWVNFNYIWMVFSLTRLNPCTDPIGTSTTLKSLSGFQFFRFLFLGLWYQVRDPWFNSQVWFFRRWLNPWFQVCRPRLQVFVSRSQSLSFKFLVPVHRSQVLGPKSQALFPTSQCSVQDLRYQIPASFSS